MYAPERHQAILAKARHQGRVEVRSLAEELDDSLLQRLSKGRGSGYHRLERTQACYLCFAQPQALQQFVGIFTLFGWLVPHAQALSIHGEGEQGRTGGLTRLGPVGEADIGQGPGRVQVWIVKQLFGFDDGRKRQPGFLEDGGQLGGGETIVAVHRGRRGQRRQRGR